MYGKSCENCIFSQWYGQNQTGCLLRRAEKYGYIKMLNDKGDGFYWVVPHLVCPAFRTKEYLQKNPKPEISIRKDLYPKIQLIVVVKDDYDKWNEVFENRDWSKFSAIDVLAFDNKDNTFNNFHRLMYKPNFFLQSCNEKLEYHINNVVRSDCHFYIIASNHEKDYSQIPDVIDKYINEKLLAISLVESEGQDYHQMIVMTYLHKRLCGFGQQSLIEKIKIDAKNNNYEETIFNNYTSFYSATIEEKNNESTSCSTTA